MIYIDGAPVAKPLFVIAIYYADEGMLISENTFAVRLQMSIKNEEQALPPSHGEAPIPPQNIWKALYARDDDLNNIYFAFNGQLQYHRRPPDTKRRDGVSALAYGVNGI